MPFNVLSSAVSGIFGLAGAGINTKAQREANEANIALQREINQANLEHANYWNQKNYDLSSQALQSQLAQHAELLYPHD